MKNMTTIPENKLKKAAYLAKKEANRWREVALMLSSNIRFDNEHDILLLLSSEIYLKAILFHEKGNISKGHKLNILFQQLPKHIQDEIKSNIDFKPIEISDFKTHEKGSSYETFEEALDKISNDFVDLRYGYEKYVEDKSLIFLNGFISEINAQLHEIADALVRPDVDNLSLNV